MKVEWKYIVLFTLIVFGLSYPIQQGFLYNYFIQITKNSILSESYYLLAGFSTLIASGIMLRVHKNVSSKISILGDHRLKHTLILCLPIIAFTVIGLNNKFGINESLYGFTFALINTVYALTEELAWRKYLQNALEGLNKYLKYVLIGVIWWIWHFRFETQFDIFIFPLICIGGGILLGKLADDLKSLLPVTAMHTLIILTTNSGNFGVNEAIGIGFVILGWILIEQAWKRIKISEKS